MYVSVPLIEMEGRERTQWAELIGKGRTIWVKIEIRKMCQWWDNMELHSNIGGIPVSITEIAPSMCARMPSDRCMHSGFCDSPGAQRVGGLHDLPAVWVWAGQRKGGDG